MKFNVKKIAVCVVAVAAIAGGAWYFMHKQDAPFEVSYETAKVEKATIGNSVTATGTIEAGTSVEVGTQVSGIIDKIYVDWNQGNYFIKAFVNGEAVGASQIKSVPFALIADGVRGVLTKRQLVGTWKASREEKGSLTYHTFNLEKDGSFSYTRKDGYEPEYYSGTWKVNNLGFITFNVTKASPYTEEVGKFVMFSVYDKDDNSLYLGGNDDFLGDGMSLYKQ